LKFFLFLRRSFAPTKARLWGGDFEGKLNKGLSMKKVLLGLALLVGLSSVVSAKTYKCYRYVNGEPVGNWVKVEADSKEDAYSKAMEKFKDLGVKADSTNCEFSSN
jgi:hypothetical protein